MKIKKKKRPPLNKGRPIHNSIALHLPNAGAIVPRGEKTSNNDLTPIIVALIDFIGNTEDRNKKGERSRKRNTTLIIIALISALSTIIIAYLNRG